MRASEEARTLLVMAGKDLQTVQGMRDAELFPTETFGFHVQQAVEKSLRAWLCIVGATYPKIHDLDELDALLNDAGQDLPEEFEPLLTYTDFATTFRYDAYPNLGGELDRADVSSRVERLVSHVRALLDEAERTG